MISRLSISFFFFFNDTATTEIYTLSLHDALPISYQEQRNTREDRGCAFRLKNNRARLLTLISKLLLPILDTVIPGESRSEEHTSELKSRSDLVCRLLLEKKKKKKKKSHHNQVDNN